MEIVRKWIRLIKALFHYHKLQTRLLFLVRTRNFLKPSLDFMFFRAHGFAELLADWIYKYFQCHLRHKFCFSPPWVLFIVFGFSGLGIIHFACLQRRLFIQFDRKKFTKKFLIYAAGVARSNFPKHQRSSFIRQISVSGSIIFSEIGEQRAAQLICRTCLTYIQPKGEKKTSNSCCFS